MASAEYLINNTKYYTILSLDKVFDSWESPKFTLVLPDTMGKVPFAKVASFMQMKINAKLPPGAQIQVYGGTVGAYSVVQSVQGVSYPNFQTSTGITPTAEFVPGGQTQIVYNGPPSPNYGSDFNLISFEQTNTFSNVMPLVFYRVTFQNTTPPEFGIREIPIDVTFNGAILASD